MLEPSSGTTMHFSLLAMQTTRDCRSAHDHGRQLESIILDLRRGVGASDATASTPGRAMTRITTAPSQGISHRRPGLRTASLLRSSPRARSRINAGVTRPRRFASSQVGIEAIELPSSDSSPRSECRSVSPESSSAFPGAPDRNRDIFGEHSLDSAPWPVASPDRASDQWLQTGRS